MSSKPSYKIGALWKNKSETGKKYLNGTIQVGKGSPKFRVKVFRNDYKETVNHPDFNIVVHPEDFQALEDAIGSGYPEGTNDSWMDEPDHRPRRREPQRRETRRGGGSGGFWD